MSVSSSNITGSDLNTTDSAGIRGGTDGTLIGNVGDRVKVIAADLPLPTGAATAANQATEIASLASIDAGIPVALGQTTMSASMPVTLASNQSTLNVSVTNVVPISTAETEAATFVVYALGIAIGNNKSMVSIVNTSGSTVKVKIREIRIINVQTVAVTGIVADFRFLKCVSHSAGTSITPAAHDSTDVLNGSITARTGATIGTEGTDVYRRWQFSTDEWGVGASDVESNSHDQQQTKSLFDTAPKTKTITLNANEGMTLKQIVNSTVGTFDIVIVFTQE